MFPRINWDFSDGLDMMVMIRYRAVRHVYCLPGESCTDDTALSWSMVTKLPLTPEPEQRPIRGQDRARLTNLRPNRARLANERAMS